MASQTPLCKKQRIGFLHPVTRTRPVWVVAYSVALLACDRRSSAGDKDIDSVSEVRARMRSAFKKGEYEAWKAEFDPDILKTEKWSYEQLKEIAKEHIDTLKFVADQAGLTTKELAEMSFEVFHARRFEFSRTQTGVEDSLVPTSRRALRLGNDSCVELEFLEPDGQLRVEEYRQVNGVWKYRRWTYRDFGLDNPAVTEAEILRRWKSAMLRCDGEGFLQLITDGRRRKYMLRWGPRLAELQALDAASKSREARALDLSPDEIDSMSCSQFVAIMLSRTLKIFRREQSNVDTINNVNKIELVAASKEHGCIADGTLQVEVSPAGGFQVRSDCLLDK